MGARGGAGLGAGDGDGDGNGAEIRGYAAQELGIGREYWGWISREGEGEGGSREWSGLWLGGEGGCWERACGFEGVVDLGRVID